MRMPKERTRWFLRENARKEEGEKIRDIFNLKIDRALSDIRIDWYCAAACQYL